MAKNVPLTARCTQLRCHWKRCPSSFSEYQLIRDPECLADLVHIVAMPSVLWVTPGAFVVMDVDLARCPRVEYRDHLLQLTLKHTVRSRLRNDMLRIHSASESEASRALNYLLGLHDTVYTHLELSPGYQIDFPNPCPISNLRKMVRPAENDFRDMLFDATSQVALADCQGSLILTACQFQDGGSSFVDAFSANKSMQLSQLTLRESLPFDRQHFVRFLLVLTRSQGFTLELRGVQLKNTDLCQALSAVPNLNLSGCQLADQGSAIINRLRQGQGPRSLVLCSDWENPHAPFESNQGWVAFADSLQYSSLKHLEIGLSDNAGESFMKALHHSLRANTALTRLILTGTVRTHECWDKIVQAVADHPSLETLQLPGAMPDPNMDRYSQRIRRTKAISKMLAENNHLEELIVDRCDRTFDWSLWRTTVVPALHCNRYRKHVLSMRRTFTNRAALLATALEKASTEPSSSSWLLLSLNQDVLSNNLY